MNTYKNDKNINKERDKNCKFLANVWKHRHPVRWPLTA